MHVVASAALIELVRSSGGRLYVWPTRSAGCQPVTRLRASVTPAVGREFHRVEFDPIELYLAAATRWPRELGLDMRRGGVRALWDGNAWAI